MKEKDSFVTVSKDGELALNGPRFLVKHGTKVYLTLAVWEYDPDAADTRAEKEGVAQVLSYFEGGRKKSHLTEDAGVSEEGAFREGSDIEVRKVSDAVAFGQATKPNTSSN